MSQTVTTAIETSPFSLPLGTVRINNTEVTIRVVSDTHEDMALACRLWYEVYIEELNYKVAEGVNHAKRQLSMQPNGSLVFMALQANRCIGTLRTTHDSVSQLEFDYSKWLPSAKFAEISKLIIHSSFRNTHLTAHLMVHTFRYHETVLAERPYTHLACHTKLKLFPYYQLFGWQPLTPESFIHPVLNYECILCKCSKERFVKACMELEMMASGNQFIKAKWAAKYLLNKWL